MLTQEQVLTAIQSDKRKPSWDGRDFARLAGFFPQSDLVHFGFSLKEGEVWKPRPWTREEIIAQLRDDVAFGFEKALGQRGISASLMRSCVKQWLWILEENDMPEADDDDYAQYGLPLLKAVAVKFGFPNLIGDDRGDESWKYGADYGE